MKSSDGGRGVSEVISVLLMVSVTIVLAAMVGTVLLNVVGDVDTNPVAGASVDYDVQNDSISVVYTANQKQGTTLSVTLYRGGTEQESVALAEVGDRTVFDGLSDGTTYRVVVVAQAEGERAVVVDKSKSL